MAAVMIPIDPDKKDDVYYRYKMPALQCKVESSGNGVKTVLPNIHEVCAAINRPEDVLMRFFQFDLGAQTTISKKDDKYLIMGSRQEEQMQQSVYSFIKKFVLCGQCKNPETVVHYDAKKKSVTKVCGACGKETKWEANRAYTTMYMYYKDHPEEATAGKGTAEARKRSCCCTAPTAAAAASAEKKATKTVIAASDLKDDRKDRSRCL
ncbi:LOW QUALITY PROTEIN: eukaryotic translation initiation factor 5-like [Bactrocera neohumeralis]|uniref:LOW QUALITY PROTEIN: eukaryotic translation initiation factor 5-like n=1 Tax=Bactrocera neohumeralis TaxID=98809 RepID=UPI00216627CF|nr:LOW QUALITY PROTEIN: eukaryotic translation initiation factor 5-like [Bactrocera neohumeralis]